MADSWKKYIVKYTMIGVIVLIVLGVLGFIAKMQWDAYKRQEAIENSLVEMKELNDKIVRNQSKYVSKEDLEEFGKNLDLDAIRDDLNTLGADVKGISKFLTSSLGYNRSNIPSSHVTPKPTDPTDPTDPANKCEDPYGYLTNTQVLGLREPFSGDVNVPIGDVSFEAWKEKPWSVHILPRDYKVDTVLGQDKDGRHYIYNKFTIATDGKDYALPIKQAEFVETYPEASWEWWNPKVAMGIGGGVSIPTYRDPLTGDVVGDIGGSFTVNALFSPFSYGETRVKPDWIFAQVGVGFDAVRQTANFSITPAAYNLGAPISFINNTYVGPTVGIDHKQNVSVGSTLSVTF